MREPPLLPAILPRAEGRRQRRAALDVELAVDPPQARLDRGHCRQDAYNREQHSEPPASRGRGPATFRATSQWLHAAFADLDRVVHHVASEGDLVWPST